MPNRPDTPRTSRILSTCALTGALAGALAAVPAGLRAQEPMPVPAATCGDSLRLASTDLASWDREAVRVLQLNGALPVSPGLFFRGSTLAHTNVCADRVTRMEWLVPDTARDATLRLETLPLAIDVESNSEYRRSRNNGALRGGVGPSVATTFGARGEWLVHPSWLRLSAAVSPRLINDANKPFLMNPPERTTFSPYAHPHHDAIDMPQRFGTTDGLRFHPGQSYVRAAVRNVELGYSTENVWLGAAQHYPILISSNAPGFPHAFLGTTEPFDIWIGKLGAQVLWARLKESDYFDDDPDNDYRMFTAILVEFSPRWIPGLHVGVSRVNHETLPPDGAPLLDWITEPFAPSFTWQGGGNAPGNGIGALLARWVLPQAGFEAWAEWSREDTPHDVWDLIDEPDWTQAYALGFHQLVELSAMRLRWYGELVHLGEAAPVRGGKGLFSYYTHSSVRQGHTHEGQVLGASIGPGSDAQILGVDAFHDYGMSGLWLERTRTDEDTYYRRYARLYGESRHDVEVGVGARHSMEVGGVRLYGEALYTRRTNRHFLQMENHSVPRLLERNLAARLRLSWTP